MRDRSRRLALIAVAGLLGSAPCGTRAGDVTNEYRLTAYPSYRLAEDWIGFGYVGIVAKPDADYSSYYLGKGAFYVPNDWLQLWAGLIGVYTNSTNQNSNSLELRPFAGVKFIDMTERMKWRYFNWTRYELRLIDTLDTGSWKSISRVRSQFRLEAPLAGPEQAWTPKTWYAFAEVEPIWRSDTGQIDPLRTRLALGYIANQRVLVEFQYYAEFTQPSGSGLAWTNNIWRLNFKVSTSASVLRLAAGGFDD
jgi:hypothetical protein